MRVRGDELITVSSSLEHQLGINELYCTIKYRQVAMESGKLIRWENLHRPIDSKRSLIPDASIEIARSAETIAAFFEFDLGHENLIVWKKKVEKYLQYAISGDFQSFVRHSQFRVLVVTNSDARLRALRLATASITDKIFWFATMDFIRRQSFWSAVWLRPTSDHPTTLL